MNLDPNMAALFAALGRGTRYEVHPSRVAVACPLERWQHKSGKDSSPSMSIRKGKAHCFACGFHGDLHSLVLTIAHRQAADPDPAINTAAAFAAVSAIEDGALAQGLVLDIGSYSEWLQTAPPNSVVFPEWMVEGMDPAYTAGAVHPYLASRHVPYWIAERLNIRYDVNKDRIVFPFRDASGILRGLHGRALGKAHPKYLYYPYEEQTNGGMWFGEHICQPGKPVVMPESVFDLARVLEVYPNVLSPWGATPGPQKLARIEGWFPAIYTLFDNDEAGDLGRRTIANYYGETAHVQHMYLPRQIKDAGDCHPDWIANILHCAGLPVAYRRDSA